MTSTRKPGPKRGRTPARRSAPRPGGPPQPPARLVVITGPPCAGKSTHAQQHAQPEDLILDLDTLATALGYPGDHVIWDDNHPAVHASRMARAHVLGALLDGRIPGKAWIIDARPDDVSLIRYHRAGAELITIDPGREVCLDRAADRSTEAVERVEAWYRATDEGADEDRPDALGVFG